MANSLPDDFWEKERGRLLAILMPALTDAAQAGVAEASRMGLTFDPSLSNHDASEWAAAYTDDVLMALQTTNERMVGASLQSWIETPGATMGDLMEKLEPAFGPSRANLIAVTEMTRAYSQGNQIAFQEAGIERWRWNTNRDDLVCPTCSPLHRKVVTIGEPFAQVKGKVILSPPAHPGCRCSCSPVVDPKAKLKRQQVVVQTLPIGGRLREARTERVEGFRITVPTNFDVNQQELTRQSAEQLIKRITQSLPSEHRESVREVRLSDERNVKYERLLAQRYGLVYDPDNHRVTSATGGNGVITFYPNMDLGDDPRWSGVETDAAHEVGHALALKLFGKLAEPMGEQADQWRAAAVADGYSSLSVNRLVLQEDWAKVFQTWQMNPMQAERRYPSRLKLMRLWAALIA